MFGRLLGYLGPLWMEHKPAAERGDRFELGAVVVNLTGTGNATKAMDWPAAGLRTELRIRERNLASLDAVSVLDDIAAGQAPTVMLPWIPLMRGGADSVIIQRWMELAGAEPDARRRGDYAGLAEVFAEAANRAQPWETALREWNMIESKVVRQWQDAAVLKATQELMKDAIETRFGRVPADVAERIAGIGDINQLKQLHRLAVRASNIDEFLAALPNGAAH